MMLRSLSAVAAAILLSAAAAPDPDATPDPSPIPKAPAGVAREAETAYRTDTLEFPLGRAGSDGSEMDYFVRMKAGDGLVYSWTVTGGDAAAFYSDFHGMSAETPPSQVLSYREGMGTEARGTMNAPFDGLHGWLFKNDAPHEVTVKLTMAGFYELRSLRETMGLTGSEYVPFGPPNWKDRYGPTQGK
jgi:hypothetical protein